MISKLWGCSETINHIEGNIGTKLMELGCRDFINLTPQAREGKANIKEWDCIKRKSFSQQKKLQTKQKGDQPNGRRHLQTIALTKG